MFELPNVPALLLLSLFSTFLYSAFQWFHDVVGQFVLHLKIFKFGIISTQPKSFIHKISKLFDNIVNITIRNLDFYLIHVIKNVFSCESKLYKRVCPLVSQLVGPSVGWLVRR